MLQTNTPPGLEDILGWGGITSSQLYNQSRQNNQINQQTALQDYYQKQQSHPVDLDYKKALTGQTIASTGNMQEQKRSLGFKNDMNDATKNEQYTATIAKLSQETNEADLKAWGASLDNAATSTTNPKELEVINALRRSMKDVWAERERISLQGNKEIAVAQVRAEETRTTNAAKPPPGQNKPLTSDQLLAKMQQLSLYGTDEEKAVANAWLKERQENAERLKMLGAHVTDARTRELLQLPPLALPKGTVGKNTPTKLSGEDQQALDWANANPNDPRAKKIKDKLGVK